MVPQTTRRRPVMLLLGGLVMLLMNACYYDNEEELYKDYYGENKCDTTVVTWTSHIQAIVQGNCALPGCHVAGGSAPGMLENYNNMVAIANNGKLADRVLVRKDMPPTSPLTDCQMKQIQAWINAGAPQ
jgi:hypothetical protein